MDLFNKALNEIEAENNFKEFIDGLPNLIKLCTMIAKSEKAYFNELVKEGFSEEQALQIVMAHGIYPGRTDRNQGNLEDK